MICVTSVSVSPGSMTLEVGEYGYAIASVSPSNATCKDVIFYPPKLVSIHLIARC